MSSRLVKSLKASSIARTVVSVPRVSTAAAGCPGLLERTLVNYQEVALPPQVYIAHARKEKAGDGVLHGPLSTFRPRSRGLLFARLVCDNSHKRPIGSSHKAAHTISLSVLRRTGPRHTTRREQGLDSCRGGSLR